MRGFAGFIGQRLDQGRDPAAPDLSIVTAPVVATNGSGTVTASFECYAVIYLFGGGASGSAGTGYAGGGGGAALAEVVRLLRGQQLAYFVGPGGAAASDLTNGNNGGDSTVTLPDGRVLRAGGGKGAVGNTPGAGGVPVGQGVLQRPGNQGLPLSAGGGAAGDLSDVATWLTGGAGGALPGGGGSGSTGGGDSQAGSAGKIAIVLIRVR